MFELTIDVLDPSLARFQLYIAIFIALVAIAITILRTLMAERQAEARRKVISEMREYKEKARKEEAHRREEDMKKWEEGEDWPTGGDKEGDKEEGPSDKKAGKEGDGHGKG